MSNVVAAILLGNGVGGKMAIAPLFKIFRVSYQNKFVKLVHLVGFIIMKFVTMHGHTNVKKQVRTNINKQRKIRNTTQNMAEHLSASWQYGNYICAFPNPSFLLVYRRFLKCVSGNEKNVFWVPAWTKC